MNNVFTAKLLQNLRSKKGDKGFTLIELLVVVIIIGVLAAVALPNLLGQVAKGRQAEARNTLGTINRTQQANRLEFGTFGTVGSYTEADPANNPGEITQAAAGTLPLALQLEYYQISDAAGQTAATLPLVATVNAVPSSVYANDILDYQSQVTQTAAGAFASILCEEVGINGTPPAANGSDTQLVTACATGREVK